MVYVEVNIMSILELRERTGLSQREFAERYHLSVRSLQQWEQGRRKPPEYVEWLVERVMYLEELLDQNNRNL